MWGLRLYHGGCSQMEFAARWVIQPTSLISIPFFLIAEAKVTTWLQT